MKIGPLTTVDYEESTQQITTQLDTYVVIQDPEMSATGVRHGDAAPEERSDSYAGRSRRASKEWSGWICSRTFTS